MWSWTALGGLAIVLAHALAIFWAAVTVLTPAPHAIEDSASTYKTAKSSNKPLKLPSVHDPAQVYLSVVVPAYNERQRIAKMLRETVEYLEQLDAPPEKQSYEIIVVDDGSKDDTSDVVLELAHELDKKWSAKKRKPRGQIKVVRLSRNRGKGAAVRHGAIHSSGERILFADADGASHFPHVQLLLEAADKMTKEAGIDHALVVGSRAHLVNTDLVVKRSVLRNLLMRGFHSYLWLLGIRSVKDTQCGFKLCTRPTARIIYETCHSPAWIFDCELILLAELANIPTCEVGIDWQEVAGSKIDLVKDSIKMALDLLVIRNNYMMGTWKKPKRVR